MSSPGAQASFLACVGGLLAGVAVSAACGGGEDRPAAAPSRAAETSAPAGSSAPGRGAAARLEFPTAREGESRPLGLLAGDLDGDGRDEIVAATRGAGGIEIWSGLSPALVPAPEPLALPCGDFPLGPVWVGSFEPAARSAQALAAVASRETNELSVVNLRGAFRARTRDFPALWRTVLPVRPRVLASGDLGRDGRSEIAVATIEDDLLLLSRPDDLRRLRLCDEIATCARFLAEGDGIAFGFQGSRRIVIYRPCATSVENPVGLEPREAREIPGLPRDLDEADLDGDGDLELAVAAGDHGVLVFGLGRPGGSSAWLDLAPAVVRCGDVPIDIEHGDLDGDGRVELVSIGLHSQDASVIAWKDGALGARSPVYAGQRPGCAALGDFDGDGTPDLAASNSDARRVSVAFADGPGRFRSAPQARSDRAPHSLASGDLDGDGRPEVIGLAAAEGTISVFRGSGGSLSDGVPQGQARSADALACADLDGDGHLDAAFLVKPGRQCSLAVAFGDGAGRLWERAATPPFPVGAGAGDLLLLDVDGDGKVDALVADPEGDRVWLLRNETEAGKDLAFAAPAGLDLPSGPRALVRLATADGTVEIAVALAGPGDRRGIAFLRARPDAAGSIALEERARLPMSRHPFSLAAGDLDGDGIQDLAVLASESGGDSDAWAIPWLRGKDGTGRPLPAMRTGERPHRIAAGDLDGDGRAEILVTAQNSHHVNLWLPRAAPEAGEGVTFARAPDLGVGTGPLDLELVDLDGDGAPEVVVANAFSHDLSIVRVE